MEQHAIGGAGQCCAAGHAVLDALATHAAGQDAVVLAISFDTALVAARQLLDIPVVGMTEASLHTACLIGQRFGLITFGASSRSLYVDLVRARGLDGRMAACLSIDVASVDAYLQLAAFDQIVLDAARSLVTDSHADVVVICGAAVAGIARRIQSRVDVPLLDGIGCAVRLAEMLVGLTPPKVKLGRRISAGVASAGLGGALSDCLNARDCLPVVRDTRNLAARVKLVSAMNVHFGGSVSID